MAVLKCSHLLRNRAMTVSQQFTSERTPSVGSCSTWRRCPSAATGDNQTQGGFPFVENTNSYNRRVLFVEKYLPIFARNLLLPLITENNNCVFKELAQHLEFQTSVHKRCSCPFFDAWQCIQFCPETDSCPSKSTASRRMLNGAGLTCLNIMKIVAWLS